MSPERYPNALIPETSHFPPVAPENLPRELLSYPQWVCWRYVARGDRKKPDKQPVNPRTLGNAGVHWPNTWCTFEQALSTYILYQERGIAGLGFVLTHEDPIVGLDIDNCVMDGEITANAHAIMRRMASYTELSPSMQGLRILVSCPNYAQNMRSPQLEVYAHSRFLTLTGYQMAGTPAAITDVEQEAMANLSPKPVVSPQVNALPDAQHRSVAVEPALSWERIFDHDQYGAQHLRRFHGDLTFDRGDHSLAVIRLLNCLARWTGGDAVRMREMMMLSPLATEKWLSRRGKDDWLDYQIRDAIAFVTRGK